MQSILSLCGKMDFFASLAMTILWIGHAFNSRGAIRPSLARPSALGRAWGMPGASAPAAAWCVEDTRVSHHESAETPGIPAREWF